MKVNFNTPIRTLAGVQMQEVGYRPHPVGTPEKEGVKYVTGEEDKLRYEVVNIALTAASFAVHVLSIDHKDEVLDDKQKYGRYELMKAIRAATEEGGDGNVNVESGDVQMLRMLFARLYNPLVHGQLVDLLEGK